MKKLIVIVALMALVLSAGIAETLFISKYFSALSAELSAIGEIVADEREATTSSVVITRLDDVLSKWRDKEGLFYLLNNNNVLNNLLDRIIQARAYALGGQNVDAHTNIESAAFSAKSIAYDIYPLPINFI